MFDLDVVVGGAAIADTLCTDRCFELRSYLGNHGEIDHGSRLNSYWTHRTVLYGASRSWDFGHCCDDERGLQTSHDNNVWFHVAQTGAPCTVLNR